MTLSDKTPWPILFWQCVISLTTMVGGGLLRAVLLLAALACIEGRTAETDHRLARLQSELLTDEADDTREKAALLGASGSKLSRAGKLMADDTRENKAVNVMGGNDGNAPCEQDSDCVAPPCIAHQCQGP